MTARPKDNGIRGAVYALLPAAAMWALVAALIWWAAFTLPQSVLFAIAAVLIIGPLVVWAFRRD